MADSSTEIRKRKKYNGEEDPIVIAQRFLNIFRQLHIFSDERKAAFDKMLLELSPEARGAFASLPGGSLVQDYIDDLEEKNGIAHTAQAKNSVTLDDDNEEISKAKILATALAEAQVQAHVQMQQMNISKPAALTPEAGGQTANMTPASLKLDKDFSRELAEALAGALAATQTVPPTPAAPAPQPNQAAPVELSSANVNAEIKIPEDFGRNLADALSQVWEKSSSQQQEDIKLLSKELLSNFNEVQQSVIAELKAANQENKAANNSLAKAFFEAQSRLVQSFNQQIQKISDLPLQQSVPQTAAMPIITNDSGSAAIQVDNSQLIEAVTSTQKQIAQMLENVSQKQSRETLELAKVLKESQTNVIEAVKSANENKKDDSTAIATILKESKQQLNEVIAATSQANKNENLEIAKILKESQLEVAKMLIQSNQINASNNQNANTIQIHNAPAAMPGGEALSATEMEKIVSGIVKAQSELFCEVSTRQTQNLSSIIATALKESQEMSAQTIAKALEGLKNLNIHYHGNLPASSYNAPITPQIIPEAYSESVTPLDEEPAVETDFENMEANLADEETIPSAFADISEEIFNEPEPVFQDTPPLAGDELLLAEEPAAETQPKKKKKKKRKKKNSTAQENLDIPVLADTESELLQENDYFADEAYVPTSYLNPAEQITSEEVYKSDFAMPEQDFVALEENNSFADSTEHNLTDNDISDDFFNTADTDINELSYEELDGYQEEPKEYQPGELWGSLQEEALNNEPIISAVPAISWNDEAAPIDEIQTAETSFSSEQQTDAPLDTDSNANEDWEWEYEEVLVPETVAEGLMLGEADQSADPYGAPHNLNTNYPQAVSQIFAGNLYFYENKVYDATDAASYIHNENSGIVIKELDEKDDFDPYLLNSNT